MSIRALESFPLTSSPLVVWYEHESRWERIEVLNPVTLPCESPYLAATADLPTTWAFVAVPIIPLDGAIGVLLARHGAALAASLNGVPIPPGLQLLRHADRLDIAGQVFWVSAAPSVEEAAYDPAVHGDDARCYLTKARLHTGQLITICPGLPGQSCGAIYKAEAWQMAMQSEPPMPCASCGFHTRLSEWQPPPARVRTPFDERFRAIFASHP